MSSRVSRPVNSDFTRLSSGPRHVCTVAPLTSPTEGVAPRAKSERENQAEISGRLHLSGSHTHIIIINITLH